MGKPLQRSNLPHDNAEAEKPLIPSANEWFYGGNQPRMTSPDLHALSPETGQSEPGNPPPPLLIGRNAGKAGDKRSRGILASLTFSGLASTILSRTAGGISLAGVALGAVVLRPTGNGPSICGLQRTAGVPCPGCGLTRSVTSSLHGEFLWAFAYNPFGPAFALAMVLTALGFFLPSRARAWMEERITPYNRVVGWTIMIVVLGLFVHGVWRIGMVLSGNPDYAWWASESTPPFVETSAP